MSSYSGFFWKEDIWLPPNVTWSDLTNYPGGGGEVNYRKFSDLMYPIPAALLLIVIRYTLERYDMSSQKQVFLMSCFYDH